MAVLDGHDPVTAPHELARQRHGQRGLSGVLPADDRDDPCRRQSSSACARSSAVFTLKKRSAGSPFPRHLGEREDTDTDARMEADGSEVALRRGSRRSRPGRRDRTRRRAARRRRGRRSEAELRRGLGDLRPGGGSASPRRTACPRRRRRPGPAPRPPRYRSHPGRRGQAAGRRRRGGRAASSPPRARSRREAAASRAPPPSRRPAGRGSARRPTRSSPFGLPPNRVAPPPARMAPRTSLNSGVPARARGSRRGR